MHQHTPKADSARSLLYHIKQLRLRRSSNLCGATPQLEENGRNLQICSPFPLGCKMGKEYTTLKNYLSTETTHVDYTTPKQIDFSNLRQMASRLTRADMKQSCFDSRKSPEGKRLGRKCGTCSGYFLLITFSGEGVGSMQKGLITRKPSFLNQHSRLCILDRERDRQQEDSCERHLQFCCTLGLLNYVLNSAQLCICSFLWRGTWQQ